jgi:arylsulfatase
MLKGKPVFVYNMLDLRRYRWEGQEVLSPGKHTIAFDFQYNGPGFGKGGMGLLKVDKNEVAKQAIPHTIPFLTTIDETFDLGLDTRTGVEDRDYKPPFRFIGKLEKVTFNLGPVLLSETEREAVHERVMKTKD